MHTYVDHMRLHSLIYGYPLHTTTIYIPYYIYREHTVTDAVSGSDSSSSGTIAFLGSLVLLRNVGVIYINMYVVYNMYIYIYIVIIECMKLGRIYI